MRYKLLHASAFLLSIICVFLVLHGHCLTLDFLSTRLFYYRWCFLAELLIFGFGEEMGEEMLTVCGIVLKWLVSLHLCLLLLCVSRLALMYLNLNSEALREGLLFFLSAPTNKQILSKKKQWKVTTDLHESHWTNFVSHRLFNPQEKKALPNFNWICRQFYVKQQQAVFQRKTGVSLLMCWLIFLWFWGIDVSNF